MSLFQNEGPVIWQWKSMLVHAVPELSVCGAPLRLTPHGMRKV